MATNPRRTYEMTCIECENSFTGRRSDALYCSERCAGRHRYRRNLGQQRAEARGARTCLECGAEFAAKRNDGRFCSKECNRRFYYHENRQRIDDWHRQWVQEHPEQAAAIKRRNRDKHGERYRENRRQRDEAVKADPELSAAKQERQRQWYREHRDEVLERVSARRQQDPYAHLFYKHGRVDWRTLFDSLWQAQDGKCYLCGDTLDREGYRRVHLDHDHTCCPLGRSCEHCRRGLACRDCNRLIGLALDDPGRLRRIADNLERAKVQVAQRIQGAA